MYLSIAFEENNDIIQDNLTLVTSVSELCILKSDKILSHFYLVYNESLFMEVNNFYYNSQLHLSTYVL